MSLFPRRCLNRCCGVGLESEKRNGWRLGSEELVALCDPCAFKQWRHQQQHESEQQHQQQTRVEVQQQCYHEKQHEQQNQQETTSSGSVLPLFVVPENLSIKSRNLSAYPHSYPILPRMGGYLSLVQLRELEMQALIYRHMVAGAAVPPDLLLLVKKSLLSSPPHHFLQHSSNT
ncbi:hypothetical protein Droror1_Dr00008849 [Drosera rotundifolia]